MKICRAYENSAGYQKFLGPGLLTRPVENQPGRWFVVFKSSGETFLNVGRHGVYELAYMEQWESKTVERKKMQEKKKKLQTQDFGEPEQVEDDTSVFKPPSCHMPQGCPDGSAGVPGTLRENMIKAQEQLPVRY